MSIPIIEPLRAEDWSRLSLADRLAALQQMEERLAPLENRPACQIGEIPESQRRLAESGEPILRGQHYTDIQGYGHIELDPNLIDDNEPYQAVETYFHEARHAYQEHVARYPEMHSEDSSKVSDWQKNLTDGYIGSEDADFSYYRWQPVEDDAKQVSRERTDEVFRDNFQDQGQYPKFQAEKEQEFADDIFQGRIQLGNNYREEARQAMLDKYETQQSLRANSSEDSYPDEGQDYAMGYGY